MTSRFTSFVLISLAAHAGLLLWTGTQPEPVQLAVGGQAAALQVSIAAPQAGETTEVAALETPVEQLTTPPATATRPAPARSRTASSRAGTIAVEPEKPLPEQDPIPARQAAVSPAGNAPSVRAQISAALHNQLLKRFEYPWLARKRGWQGKVTLSLRIAQDGVLSDWKVAQTSGYAVLDRSALAAAKAIGRLPDSSALLRGRSLQLTIPVEYQLLDS